MSEYLGFRGPDYERPGNRLRYKVEHHNIETNQWETLGEREDLDDAFDLAAGSVGISKIHDTISISEDDVPIWDSKGFSQGTGNSLPSANKIHWNE